MSMRNTIVGEGYVIDAMGPAQKQCRYQMFRCHEGTLSNSRVSEWGNDY